MCDVIVFATIICIIIVVHNSAVGVVLFSVLVLVLSSLVLAVQIVILFTSLTTRCVKPKLHVE